MFTLIRHPLHTPLRGLSYGHHEHSTGKAIAFYFYKASLPVATHLVSVSLFHSFSPVTDRLLQRSGSFSPVEHRLNGGFTGVKNSYWCILLRYPSEHPLIKEVRQWRACGCREGHLANDNWNYTKVTCFRWLLLFSKWTVKLFWFIWFLKYVCTDSMIYS